MGRGYLIKWKVLACLMLVLTACRADKLSNRSEGAVFADGALKRTQHATSSLGSAEDMRRHYSSIADSVASDPELDYPNWYAFAVDSLLDPKWIEDPDSQLTVGKKEVLSTIRVSPFNGHFLITFSDKDLQRNLCRSTHVFLVDDNERILDSMQLIGAKYDAGEVQVVDVDNDGISEFWYSVTVHAASVNSGYVEERLIKYADGQLVPVVNYVSKSWNCTAVQDETFDEWTRTPYFIDAEKFLFRLEKRWTNCWNQLWKDEAPADVLVEVEEEAIFLNTMHEADDNLLYDVISANARCSLYRKKEKNSEIYIVERFNQGQFQWRRKVREIAPWAHLDSVYNDFVALSFGCGGPCSAKTLVFNDAHRPNETYSYSYIVPGHENLILFVRNEAFESLWIRNLENSKELAVKLFDVVNLDRFPYSIKNLRFRGNRVSFDLILMNSTEQRSYTIDEII